MANLFTPESRQATMERICALLRSDDRIDGILLVGYADDLPTAEREPLEETLVPSLEPQRLLKALQIATRAFVSELEKGEPTLAAKLKTPLLGFVDTIAE